MNNFWNLIKREFTLFYQNKVLLILFLGAPIMCKSSAKSGHTIIKT